MFKSAISNNTVQGEIPGTTPEIPGITIASRRDELPELTLPVPGEVSDLTLLVPGQAPNLKPPAKFISDVKADAQTQILLQENQHTFHHIQTLVKQGHFLELTKLEQTDATWKSYIYNLPKGTMKFILNSSIDTLPSKANLKLWGKVVNDKCFCGQKQTLNHILNCCKIALDQGRFTFRHDNLLNYISKCLDKQKFKCYIDIPGHQTEGGGTIPPSLLVTSLKPDIVIIDNRDNSVKIFELTVPAEHRIDTASKLKMAKYQHFSSDISTHTTSVVPFEVGSHTGYISSENKKNLHTLHKFCTKDIKFKKFQENLSSIAAISSYYIFNCRNQNIWSNTDPILAPFKHQ